jgi:hypothetical protein
MRVLVDGADLRVEVATFLKFDRGLAAIALTLVNLLAVVPARLARTARDRRADFTPWLGSIRIYRLGLSAYVASRRAPSAKAEPLEPPGEPCPEDS